MAIWWPFGGAGSEWPLAGRVAGPLAGRVTGPLAGRE